MAPKNTKRPTEFESTSKHARIGDKRPKQSATGSSQVQSSETPQRFTWPENPAELMNKIPNLTRNARASAKKRLKARLEELGYAEPPSANQIYVLETRHWLQSYAARLEFSKKQLEVKGNQLAGCSSREEFDNAKERIRAVKKRVANEVRPKLQKERDKCEKLSSKLKEQDRTASEQLLGLLNEFDVLIRDYGIFGGTWHNYVQPTTSLEPRENPRYAAASSVASSSPNISPARTPSNMVARASPKSKRGASPLQAPTVPISGSSNAGHLSEAPQDDVAETGIYSGSIFEELLDENDSDAWLHFT